MTDHQSPDNDSTPETTPHNEDVKPESADETQETEVQPTQAQRTEPVANHDEAAPTDMIGTVQTGPGSRDRTTKRVLIVAGAVVLVTALAFGLTHIIRKDAQPAVEETAAAEVFLQPATEPGDSPFAPTGFATTQPEPTNPGTDPLPPPPPAPPADQTAPMALRTANGDLPGLYGGTLDTTTCDAELMIKYLEENPNKARAFAGVHRINSDQIRAYVTDLTPVLLRTDTRVTDHGYIEVAQAVSRQAVLQAGTAVMVDKYGSPRVRCISGSPLLDPVALTAPAARPAGNGSVAVQPAAASARPRVIFVGPRWPRFDPLTVVVIRRVIRIIEYLLIWDFRRGALIARRIGILIRDIANLLDPRLARIVPVNLLPRPVPARPPVQAPLPLQPPRPAPQRPPVQQAPPPRPPVQQLPAQIPPVQQAPAPAAPPIQQPPALVPVPPPIVDTWDPPIYTPPAPIIDTWDPPVMGPGTGGHSEGLVPQQQMPEGPGVHVPAITDPCSNPAYPCLPQAPSSGGDMPSGGGGHETAPIPEDGGNGGYTPPDYGSLPGPSDGGNVCDANYESCY